MSLTTDHHIDILGEHDERSARIGDEVVEEAVGPGSAFFKVGGIPHQMAVVGDVAPIRIGCKV